jgi:hypothetical protein
VDPTGLNPATSQGFARCARFTLGYYHAVGFADWLSVVIVEVTFCAKQLAAANRDPQNISPLRGEDAH